jgi:hypothetical protein
MRRPLQTSVFDIGDGYKIKFWLTFSHHQDKNVVLWGSVAIAKSNRQLNDWFERRKNKRSRKLTSKLTGKIGIRSMECGSASPDKQYQIWKKWFLKHEDKDWQFIDEFKQIYFYKT